MKQPDRIDGITAALDRIASRINAVPTAKLLLCLVAIFLAWRFLSIDFMEKSGDAVGKWGFLRYYTTTGEWFPAAPDHHQSRWGINLPVMALLEIFGDSHWVYYVFPLFTALGTGIFLFLLTAELRSKAAGAAAFLICLLFPLTVRESTQFLPMLPAALFALASAWLLLRHIKTGVLWPVFWSGLLIGVSYGCKVTSLYWAAAFLLFLSLRPSEKREWFHIWKFHFGPAIALFSLGLLLVLVAETLLINHFFGTTFGHAEVILGSHLHNRLEPQYKTLLEYLFSFVRPLDFTGKYFDSIPVAMLFLAALPLAFLWCRRGSKEQCFIAFSFLTVYVLHCYMVYKVFPFLHPERPHGRYYLILAAFGIIVVAGNWHNAGDLLKKHLPRRAVVALQGLFLGAFLLLMLIRAGNQFSHGEWVFAVMRTDRHFEEARAEGLPVLSRIQDEKEFLAGRISSQDFKYGDLWITFFGPVAAIPDYGKEFHPVRDESGRLWLLLFSGRKVAGGVPTRALLLDENDSELKTVRLAVLPPVRMTR